MRLTLTINGRARDVDVPASQTLLEVLRDALGIFDVKEGCGEGVCGACTVLLDGRPVSSCLVLAPTAARRTIETVRSLEGDDGLHPLQQAFLRHGAVQCGFCTPGMLLTGLAFLQRHPGADREAIRQAIEGNLCRCTGYAKILDALEAYALDAGAQRTGSPGAPSPSRTLPWEAGGVSAAPHPPQGAARELSSRGDALTPPGYQRQGAPGDPVLRAPTPRGQSISRNSLERALRLIGRPVVRHDARDKVVAATAYAGDWAMPGMLHGVVVRSPYPSARIRSIDTRRAASMPGVAAVMTAGDVPRNTLWTDVPGQTTQVGPLRARLHVLAEDRVRHQGEPIALIAAETLEQAREAAEAVVVDYEPLPGVFDPAAALEPGAPRVHEPGNLLAHWNVKRGNLAAGFARADVVVEGEYRTQFVDAAYLEPESGVAWVDSDGVITIRLSTQVIEHFRDVAEVLGVPQNRVRVIGAYLGGGFGGKEDVTVEVYLGLLAWRTRRPVKMVWTRVESLLARAKRHPYRLRYRTGALRTGEIVAQQIDLLGDSGGYAYLSALVLLYSTVTAAGPYRVPAAAVEARVAYTNNPPTSAMRGFGAMQVVFGYESQMDRVARALGLSPVEIRRVNALRRGDALPVGQTIETHVALPELVERAWSALGEPATPRAPHLKVGRGLACNLQPYGRIVWLHDWSSAWVGFEMDGSLVVRSGVPDVGGGQASSLCQIAAEILGVPLERVSVHIADSALTPLAGTTTASRQLYMSGNAVLKAAGELREQLLSAAGRMLGAEAATLEMADDAVGAPDGRTLPLVELLRGCARMGVPRSHLGVYHAPAGEPVDLETGSGKIFPDYTFGCHAAEVEVDTQTGRVRVLKLVAAHDVGRAINPQSVEGQIQGGAVQGLGYALMEEVVLEDGINQTTSFASYLIPGAGDVPDVEPVVVESGEGLGPFGARGIGEPPIGPPAAAIANAIEDATGARVTQLPITTERVARSLGLLRDDRAD